MRPTHVCYDQENQCLFASTNRGLIQRLDLSMNIIATSNPVYNLNNLYVIIIDETYIYARDIAGRLARWRKDNLKLDTIIDLTAWSAPDEADVPNVSHGLFFHDESIYVSMPNGRIGRFRQSDLKFLGLSEYRPHALIECFELTGPAGHFAVDFSGYLYQGDVNGSMAPVSRIANGACHQIIYDRRHDRYWVTDDYHCSLSLFRAADLKNFERYPITNDDVEWMAFNADQSELLVACFDRYVYRIRNEAQPTVINRIGPLKYQVNHVIWPSENLAYAMTESGEIYRINPQTGEMEKGPSGTNCVWDIRRTDDGAFLVAFEDGWLRRVRVDGTNLKIEVERDLGLGMVRRVLPIGDDCVALTTGGHVMRLDQDMSMKWIVEARPLLRDLARGAGRLLFCSESGELACLDESDGRAIWRRNLNLALWSVTIDPSGTTYYVTSRLCERGDQGTESSGKPAVIVVGSMDSGAELRRHTLFGNIKRMQWLDDQRMLINGNGQVATSLVRAEDFTIERRWEQWQLNTCEATLVHNAKLYTTTYGYQLNTFGYSGEILESAFPFEDYATSLASVDDSHILAGGRGAFLSLFTLREGLPVLAVTKRFA
jgi:hypothetical protein